MRKQPREEIFELIENVYRSEINSAGSGRGRIPARESYKKMILIKAPVKVNARRVIAVQEKGNSNFFSRIPYPKKGFLVNAITVGGVCPGDRVTRFLKRCDKFRDHICIEEYARTVLRKHPLKEGNSLKTGYRKFNLRSEGKGNAVIDTPGSMNRKPEMISLAPV